jgi:hypothetical protein
LSVSGDLQGTTVSGASFIIKKHHQVRYNREQFTDPDQSTRLRRDDTDDLTPQPLDLDDTPSRNELA